MLKCIKLSGKKITNCQDKYKAIRKHFKQHFNDATESEMEPFNGIPTKLNKPFTQDEIRSSIKKLSNNRAPGFDNITCELIKWGQKNLQQSQVIYLITSSKSITLKLR